MTNANDAVSPQDGNQTMNSESSQSSMTSASMTPDALAPDAPIYQLLSLRHNPLVANMTQSQLIDYVRKLKEFSTSSTTAQAKLNSDSERIKPKRQPSAKTAERKALLDLI